MKKLLLSCTMLSALGISAQNVNIPDAAFKAYLVGNSSINTNMDTEIQVSEAIAYTGDITCINQNILDLTGIEAFVNLTELDVTLNQLTSLNITQNTALTTLICSQNNLTSLDVSQNVSLATLTARLNDLASLDVSQNAMLSILECDQNQLTAIDVTNNPALTKLWCSHNDISTLDVTQNGNLEILWCGFNNISTLDISQNTALEDLRCYGNNIVSLDASLNTNLTIMSCYENDLTSLYMTNGNNTNVTIFDATDNINLSCIEVDDAAYSSANWTDIDATTSFDEDCCYMNTTILVNGGTLTAELNTMAYQWIDCDNGNQPIAGATNQSFTPTSNGNYACIVDNLVCSDTSECIAVTNVGITEYHNKMIEIFPNPATDQITIDGDIISVKIYDINGSLVQSETTNQFSISNLEAGMYVAVVLTEDGIKRAQFVKQ